MPDPQVRGHATAGLSSLGIKLFDFVCNIIKLLTNLQQEYLGHVRFMGGRLFGLDLVVKLHGVGKTFVYLNVSVSMVGLGLLLLESDGCWIIRVLFARQSLESRGRPTAGLSSLACAGVLQ